MSSILSLTALHPAPLPAADLLAAAAADLAAVQTPLAQAFARQTGHRVTFTTGSSGMLARQIANGAPYDVFLSANRRYVDDLAGTGHIAAGSVRDYAVGRLGLWSRGGRWGRLEDLTAPGVRHVAIPNPAHAPYGVAARQALERRGLWERVAAKVVYGENVRQTLQYAESGNADAAITAWSLVFDKGAVLLPEEWHGAVRQSAGVVSSSRRQREARQFLDFLTGPEARAILLRHGFAAPR